MTQEQKIKIISSVFQKEGSYCIDSDGQEAYFGVNENNNSDTQFPDFWNRVRSHTIKYNMPKKFGDKTPPELNKELNADSACVQMAYEIAGTKYWMSDFDNYNDLMCSLQLFDARYNSWSGVDSVLKNQFPNGSGQYSARANSDPNALQKIINQRCAFYDKCTFPYTVKDPVTGRITKVPRTGDELKRMQEQLKKRVKELKMGDAPSVSPSGGGGINFNSMPPQTFLSAWQNQQMNGTNIYSAG